MLVGTKVAQHLHQVGLLALRARVGKDLPIGVELRVAIPAKIAISIGIQGLLNAATSAPGEEEHQCPDKETWQSFGELSVHAVQ